MNKIQRPWSEISDELDERLKDSQIDANYLKNKVGIDYWAARRILLGHTKNKTKSAIMVCSFLGISLDIPKKLQSESGQNLMGAIYNVWDGTSAHAQVIIDLINISVSFKANEDGSVTGGAS